MGNVVNRSSAGFELDVDLEVVAEKAVQHREHLAEHLLAVALALHDLEDDGAALFLHDLELPDGVVVVLGSGC